MSKMEERESMAYSGHSSMATTCACRLLISSTAAALSPGSAVAMRGFRSMIGQVLLRHSMGLKILQAVLMLLLPRPRRLPMNMLINIVAAHMLAQESESADEMRFFESSILVMKVDMMIQLDSRWYQCVLRHLRRPSPYSYRASGI